LAELLNQQRHAVEMAERMRGLDVRLLQEWERLGALAYDERRAKLREFNVGVTLWKRDHEPRFAIDWAFDLSAWGDIDEEAEPWVMYTKKSSTPAAPLVNSSVRSKPRDAPAVPLRLTDKCRDSDGLITLAAD
jgi:hypothetical protein